MFRLETINRKARRMSDDTVLVEITGTRRVRYAAKRRITRSEWDRWCKRRNSISDHGCEMEFGDLLPSSAICDQDDVEDFNIILQAP